VGFINWPQFYAAEAEKIKGGIFNDRKCIKKIIHIKKEGSERELHRLAAGVLSVPHSVSMCDCYIK
jgi:hypothetical protein